MRIGARVAEILVCLEVGFGLYPIPVGERFVIVHRSYDPIQTEHLGQILREAGIAARMIGTRSAAIIGVAQNIVQVHLEVPGSQAGQATDFLEAYFEQDGTALLGDELPDELADAHAPDDEEEAYATGDRPLSPLLAAGAVILILGFGHVYGRRLWTAIGIAAGQVWAIRLMVTSTVWAGVATGTLMFATLVMCDLVGAQLAVRSHNRGLRRSLPAQLAIGALFVSLAVGLGSLLGPRVPQPKREIDPYAAPMAMPIPLEY